MTSIVTQNTTRYRGAPIRIRIPSTQTPSIESPLTEYCAWWCAVDCVELRCGSATLNPENSCMHFLHFLPCCDGQPSPAAPLSLVGAFLGPPLGHRPVSVSTLHTPASRVTVSSSGHHSIDLVRRRMKYWTRALWSSATWSASRPSAGEGEPAVPSNVTHKPSRRAVPHFESHLQLLDSASGPPSRHGRLQMQAST